MFIQFGEGDQSKISYMNKVIYVVTPRRGEKHLKKNSLFGVTH